MNNTLNKVGKELGEFVNSLVGSLDDGKISLLEGVGIGKELATLGVVVYSNASDIGTALKDGISEDDAESLYSGFSEAITTDNQEEIEFYFDQLLDLLVSLTKIIFRIKPNL